MFLIQSFAATQGCFIDSNFVIWRRLCCYLYIYSACLFWVRYISFVYLFCIIWDF